MGQTLLCCCGSEKPPLPPRGREEEACNVAPTASLSPPPTKKRREVERSSKVHGSEALVSSVPGVLSQPLSPHVSEEESQGQITPTPTFFTNKACFLAARSRAKGRMFSPKQNKNKLMSCPNCSHRGSSRSTGCRPLPSDPGGDLSRCQGGQVARMHSAPVNYVHDLSGVQTTVRYETTQIQRWGGLALTQRWWRGVRGKRRRGGESRHDRDEAKTGHGLTVFFMLGRKKEAMLYRGCSLPHQHTAAATSGHQQQPAREKG
ncbi:uncharacterized protein AKAME5_000263100 [Lates japonicus]|uniref:Uncharacterized protein n=1 Tax=Lates japonicus TaxID=270547 RepID=A0AAD3M7A0_LATJO|nr:uncharacterized protein AKAME5_000263100 [Lates japonicus]